jgi:hypothetical protein
LNYSEIYVKLRPNSGEVFRISRPFWSEYEQPRKETVVTLNTAFIVKIGGSGEGCLEVNATEAGYQTFACRQSASSEGCKGDSREKVRTEASGQSSNEGKSVKTGFESRKACQSRAASCNDKTDHFCTEEAAAASATAYL